MWIKLLFFIIFIVLYFHLYVILKINIHNQVNELDDNEELDRNILNSEIALKSPFIFIVVI